MKWVGEQKTQVQSQALNNTGNTPKYRSRSTLEYTWTLPGVPPSPKKRSEREMKKKERKGGRKKDDFIDRYQYAQHTELDLMYTENAPKKASIFITWF